MSTILQRSSPSATATSGPADHPRPVTERVLIALLVFQGLTGAAGGQLLLTGGSDALPERWLDDLPFDTWVWPAVILGIGLGLSALILAYGLLRRPAWPWLGWLERLTGHHWSWIGSVALGLGLVAWILAELWLLPDQLWALQGLYLAVGAAIVGLACSPQVRARLRRDG